MPILRKIGAHAASPQAALHQILAVDERFSPELEFECRVILRTGRNRPLIATLAFRTRADSGIGAM
jgi:hypothetical protein